MKDLKVWNNFQFTQLDAQIPLEEKFNRKLKHYRCVVENSISHIRKWKICYHKFYSKVMDLNKVLEEHHFIVEIVAGLVNKFSMPIRTYNGNEFI